MSKHIEEIKNIMVKLNEEVLPEFHTTIKLNRETEKAIDIIQKRIDDNELINLLEAVKASEELNAYFGSNAQYNVIMLLLQLKKIINIYQEIICASMQTKFKVTVGDWSKDGHNQSKEYYLIANYPLKDMQEAYRQTCAKLDLSMHHDYNRNRDDWRNLLVEWEESQICEEATNILKEHGFDFSEFDGDAQDGNGEWIVKAASFEESQVFDLFMWFISYSMPNDFKWERVADKAEPINGWWGDLNIQIGYGCFW